MNFSVARFAAIPAVCLASHSPAQDWLQWGGPGRDFVVPQARLADSWPEDGPRIAWERELGDGYSSILFEGDTLYTMFRRGDDEVLIALNADSGADRWEASYPAPVPEGMDRGYGIGPRATPLIHGDLIYTAGVGAKLNCWDKKSGEHRWGHDLREQFGATIPNWGYASSPLISGDTLIAPVGGDGKAVMAFDARSGEIKWGNIDGENSYSSSIIIDVDGQPQLIILLAKRVVGLNPVDGEEYWSFPHETMYDINATLPLWMPDHKLLAISSAYNTGSRVLRLTRDGEATRVDEVWAERRLGVQHGMFIRDGERLYMGCGMMGPGFVAAAEVNSGKILWRERFAKSTLLSVGDKLLLLGEDGLLALARPSDDGLNVLARMSLFTGVSWTVPTLAGDRLFARDRERIVALRLP